MTNTNPLRRLQEGRLGRIANPSTGPTRAGVVAEEASQKCFVQGDVQPPSRLISGPKLMQRLQHAGRIHMLDGHPVLGERPGFVGTDHRGAAQRLNRGQLADDGLAFGHAVHANRQNDGDDGGQFLRNRANR